jgi:hypothetical protein
MVQLFVPAFSCLFLFNVFLFEYFGSFVVVVL